MPDGAQTAVTGFVASKIETVSGTAEDVPDQFIVLRGDMSPVPKKPAKSNDNVQGSILPTMPQPGKEGFDITLPFYPILKGNGLGPHIAALMGSDAVTELVASYAYEHVCALKPYFKTYTLFCHYMANDDDRIRMCGNDTLTIKSKGADNTVEVDIKAQGAQLKRLTDGSVPTDQFSDPNEAHIITHAGMRMEFGQPGAEARQTIEELTTEIKRNLSFGPPSKPGQHPQGSAAARQVRTKNTTSEMKIKLEDIGRVETLRAMAPTNGTPLSSTDQYSDDIAFVKSRCSWFGVALAQAITGEADYCNAGTTGAEFAGTYTGTGVTVGEIQISELVYQTALGANKDLSFHLLDAAATIAIQTGSTLGVAVNSKAITVTLATGGSTASAILAALLNSAPACALMDFALAPGSTGAGTVTDALSAKGAANCIDGFRFRYSETGAEWSDWSSWRAVAKTTAQDLINGITVEFDDDDTAEEGDMFYFCSHIREMLRVEIPYQFYKDIPKVSFKDGARMLEIDLNATANQGDETTYPKIIIINGESAAFV